MEWSTIFSKQLDIGLDVFLTGEIEASVNTYTQEYGNQKNNDRFLCAINAYHFRHPVHGDVMIDAGFSDDFFRRPPYGNLGLILRLFQKINNVKYMQKENQGIQLQLEKHGISPEHIFLTHRHPDHTSGISYLDDKAEVYYGKKENTFFYKLLTHTHLKHKKANLLDLDKGVEVPPFKRVLDIFGDQSLFAVSTRGHTVDHISYLLNGKKPYLMIGDAELTKDISRAGTYVNSDYGKRGETDARDSADQIREFTRKYPQVVACYSHDFG